MSGACVDEVAFVQGSRGWRISTRWDGGWGFSERKKNISSFIEQIGMRPSLWGKRWAKRERDSVLAEQGNMRCRHMNKARQCGERMFFYDNYLLWKISNTCTDSTVRYGSMCLSSRLNKDQLFLVSSVHSLMTTNPQPWVFVVRQTPGIISFHSQYFSNGTLWGVEMKVVSWDWEVGFIGGEWRKESMAEAASFCSPASIHVYFPYYLNNSCGIRDGNIPILPCS